MTSINHGAVRAPDPNTPRIGRYRFTQHVIAVSLGCPRVRGGR